MNKIFLLFFTCVTAIFSQSFNSPLTNPFNLDNAGSFNSPVFVDIDNDNDYDCFSGLGIGQTAYYKNTGTQSFPAFAAWYYAISFGIFDVGNNAKPAFADLDSDGDFDLYVGESLNKILFFRNTSATTPNFNYISENPAGISGLGSNVAPVFIDIDDDGDFDLFTGQQDGNILFFRNVGTRFNPSWANPLTNPFGLSDVGSRSSPSFSDIDKDGDYDAFIGNEAGNIIFFRNIGTKTNPSFDSPQTNPFGLEDVGTNSAPSFADIDNDGKEDLFVGSGTGDTYYFRNTTIVSVEEEQNSSFVEVKAYPNPVSNMLNVSGSYIDLDQTELSVYSILGEKLNLNITRNGTLAAINFTDLAPGIYILVIKNDVVSYSTKIIKSGKGF
ncbi:MAG TPA: T9SS type A sorting domain-containing protein [Ignavibacteriaceae bacterium]|nr:T9SS type A sorting domain-containing protein [Ignavibacteriaceae bacterium]